jgi:predicted glycoside hydrolase/deacetylase ChbG (UPF0249 family)
MHCAGLLIVNADDLGHDTDATDRTIECFRAGCITSASAMVFMADSDRASALVREAGLPVGLHINLSEDFTDPKAPPEVRERQGSLARRFGGDRGRQLLRWLYDPRIRADVEACISDQLARFSELYDEPPTHVDGHQHVHLCPNVFLARSLPAGIRMRGTLGAYPLDRSPLALARTLRQRWIARRFRSPDHVVDIADVDPRRPDARRRAWLDLTDGATLEVMAHPGFGHEHECLVSPEWDEALRGRPLGSYADFTAPR